MTRTSSASDRLDAVAKSVLHVLSSRTTFIAIVVTFTAGSIWIALTADFPLLYDERTHWRAILQYVEYGTPFPEQDLESQFAQDLTRNGSYLYRYLLSFPVIWGFGLGLSEYQIIVALRLTTIGFATATLVAIRVLCRELGAPGTVTNVTVALYAALPLTAFLAAHINYDNLSNLLGIVFMIAVVRFLREPTPRWETVALGTFSATAMSLSKYTSLLIVAPALVILIIMVVARARETGWRSQVPTLTPRRGSARWYLFWTTATLALIGVALVIERFGVNLFVYRAIQPACDVLHPVEFCMQSGLWSRNQAADAAFDDLPPTIGGALQYFLVLWVPGIMWSASYLGAGGNTNAGQTTELSIAILAAFALSLLVILVLVSGRIFRNRTYATLAAMTGFYLACTFAFNYLGYTRWGQPFAVQGRYLLPIAPLLFLGATWGAAVIVRSIYRRQARAFAVAAIVAAFLALTQVTAVVQFARLAHPTWIHPESPLGELTQIAAALTLLIAPG